MKNIPDNFRFSNISFNNGNDAIGNRAAQVSQLLVRINWESSDIIDFDTFKISGIRNNFHLFFLPKSMFGPIYRSQDFFVKFQHEHPELVHELDSLNLAGEIDSEEKIIKLYEAYIFLKLANPSMFNKDLFK